MDLIMNLFDFVMNLDKNLTELAKDYGIWTYLVLFVIVFCETGLVVTPFLPGDSMIFVIGALSASGELNLAAITIVLVLAAILGDTVNYHIGKRIGPKIFHKENVRFLKKEYLMRTHEFYETHGGKTIIIARFIPIIRTFAPFVAGMGRMTYWRFISYNIIGAVIWVALFIAGGYFFGNIPTVKENFTLVIFAIIVISLLPGVATFINNKRIKTSEERT
ncbi:DedA family protein [Desulfosporosinus metallidurans]|uniref:DedA protein n=1 Tax=Desulfosporosinus metallidurans TaxID=1888891 RepID=A0A1Q8QL61_9FIRM|nr:DedA family protein [Desulfosporosinus metallidurans]OLN27998.1 DedA protein [Desulfosporosinus metallidurans]